MQTTDDHATIPPRCDSRMAVKRPPLRRSEKHRRLPNFGDDSGSDDSDDDCDRSFCSSLLSARLRGSFSPDASDPDSDSDDDADAEFAQFIRFTPVAAESLNRPTAPHLPSPPTRTPNPPPPPLTPPLMPLPTATGPPEFDFAATPVYHGFSYSALALVRRVWDCRRDQWASGALRRHTGLYPGDVAYDGIDTAPRLALDAPAHALAGPTRPLSSENSAYGAAPEVNTRVATADPNARIYPRIGEVASLRDGESALVDRAFCRFPMYTIHKILYLHEMLYREPPREDAGDIQPRSVSPTSSDEERTLVGDEGVCSEDDDGKAKQLPDTFARPALTAREWQRSWLSQWQVLTDMPGIAAPAPFVAAEDATLQTNVFEVAANEQEAEGTERQYMLGDDVRPRSPRFFFPDDDDMFDYIDILDDEDGDIYFYDHHSPDVQFLPKRNPTAMATAVAA